MYCYHDLMTPKKLCEKYSQVSLIGWNSAKLSIFLNANLIVGVPKKRTKPAVIREKSFLELLKYAMNIQHIKSRMLNPDFPSKYNLMTPVDLFEAYPSVELNSWTASEIGMFANCSLLISNKKNVGRSCLIVEQSFINLIDYSNGVLEWKKVYVKKKR